MLVRIGLRVSDAAAYEGALRLIADRRLTASERVNLIDVLGQLHKPDCVPTLLRLLDQGEPANVRLAAIAALQPFPGPQIAEPLQRMSCCFRPWPNSATSRLENSD